MLNNKVSTYVLLVLVILIWGIVIFRIFVHNGNVVLHKDVAIKERKTHLQNNKDFNLSKNYSNPFNDYLRKDVKLKINLAKTQKTKDTFEKKAQVKIALNGIVMNNYQKTAHVTVDNKYYIVSVGDTILGSIVIKEIKLDSIKFQTKGKLEWIKKD